jgi:uroporphyrinogen decarboxylase
MTSKDRVLNAVNRNKNDRIPLFYRDVPEVDRRLRDELEVTTRDQLLEKLGIDFRWISPAYIGPDLGAPESGRIRNIFGIEYIARNAGKGAYWEPEKFPLEKVEDPEVLDDYPRPTVDWFDFTVIVEQLELYKDYAIMTAPGVASSPGVLSVIQDLFGMEKTLIDMYINPVLWKKTSEKIMEFNMAFIEKLYETAGSQIDFFRIGEDYGTQRGLLFGPDQWKEFIQPTLLDMTSIPKKHGSYYYQHTCGGVRDLIPLLIETGVDVLDPIQILADGMDPSELKVDFGDTITFSGGIDEQQLLPNGSPDEIKEEVFRILDIFGPGGGYFLGSTHNFQEDIPIENIIAMYSAAIEWDSL